jgi:hypothetical protein
MGGRFVTARVAAALVVIGFAVGCGAGDSATGGGETGTSASKAATKTAPKAPATTAPTETPTASVAGCVKAPNAVVSAISDGFTNATFELHDAKMLAVPPDEQNSRGYPKNMVAGNITGPKGAAPSAVGVWAIGTAASPGPIFALNPGAQKLTDWGAAIQDGSVMARNRDIMASSDSAKAVQDCL